VIRRSVPLASDPSSVRNSRPFLLSAGQEDGGGEGSEFHHPITQWAMYHTQTLSRFPTPHIPLD